MTAEIKLQVPYHHPLYQQLADGLLSAVSLATVTTVEAKGLDKTLAETEDQPRSHTFADGLAIGRAVERKEASDAYEPFIDKTRTADAAPLSVRKLKCAVDPDTAAEVAETIAKEIQPSSPTLGDAIDLTHAAEIAAQTKTVQDRSDFAGTLGKANKVAFGIDMANQAGISTFGLSRPVELEEAAEDDKDTPLDPARSAQLDHLGEAASSSSSKLWQREELLLEHMRCNPDADFRIGIRTVINGGFIVVATSADFNTKSDELVCCSTPAELLSAIALLCGFAEHG